MIESKDNFNLPQVSVIIPVYNADRTLPALLSSLTRQTYPQEKWKLLTVDNGSTDATPEILRSFSVRFVREERRGVSFARNRGIRETDGEIVIFVDADCIAEPEWISHLVNGFRQPDIAVVLGQTLSKPHSLTERYADYMHLLNSETHLFAPPLGIPFLGSANIAFRREAILKIGLFDEYIFTGHGGEDVDLGWRYLLLTDYRIGYSPQAIIYHQHRSNFHSFYRQLRNYTFYGKHLRQRYYFWQEYFTNIEQHRKSGNNSPDLTLRRFLYRLKHYRLLYLVLPFYNLFRRFAEWKGTIDFRREFPGRDDPWREKLADVFKQRQKTEGNFFNFSRRIVKV